MWVSRLCLLVGLQELILLPTLAIVNLKVYPADTLLKKPDTLTSRGSVFPWPKSSTYTPQLVRNPAQQTAPREGTSSTETCVRRTTPPPHLRQPAPVTRGAKKGVHSLSGAPTIIESNTSQSLPVLRGVLNVSTNFVITFNIKLVCSVVVIYMVIIIIIMALCLQ